MQKQEKTWEKLSTTYQKLQAETSDTFEKMKVDEVWELGIDEAGRGPVFGPMVYGSCMWPLRYKELLASSGFDDSKNLTEDQREAMFKHIIKLEGQFLHYETNIMSAEFLSTSQQAYIPINLNELSHQAAIQLIQNAINEGYNIKHCYLDTVGPKASYQKKLEERFQNTLIKFTVEEKADSKYPVVSAASICAKVTRDHQIIELSSKYTDSEVGSGYPSDPKTKKWLDKNFIQFFGYTKDLRFSWMTTKNAMQEKCLILNYETEREQKESEKEGTLRVNNQLIKPKTYRSINYCDYQL